MCGIGGLILSPPGPVKPEWMHAFLKRLEHRGPDDMGWLSMHRESIRHGQAIQSDLVAELVLLHRRLSILDLSDAGRQPMGTADGRYWIVFNGEIYNYVELREELRSLGHRFRSGTDTEVLLAAYAQWGTQSFNRLVGMFAFAIMDVQTRRLLLARDFFGIKPLYYTYWQDGLAFASEIAVLLELPGVGRLANPQRLYDYLYSGITDHGAETFFASIKQLPSAHYIEVSLDDPQAAKPVRYWEVDMNATTDLSFDDAAKRLRELFLDSIHLHLRSDVPIGAALSGGIDSSSIVMAMRHLDRDLDIHTFSYVADDPAINEECWIDLIGNTADVRIHKSRPTPGEMVADLDELIRIQGEPFGSTSIYAQSRVFRLAREAGIKVMLDGQGADELLAGYPIYCLARITSLLRQGRWIEAWRLASSSSTPVLLKAIVRTAPASVQAFLCQVLRRDAMPSWLNDEWFKARGIGEPLLHHTIKKPMLKTELYQTLTETSLPQLLHYEDRNSMAFSIESRVPFLTPTLASFLLALPEGYILSLDGTTKSVFRCAMRGVVPDAILNRRDKLGFPTPERHWLFSLLNWAESVLMSRDSFHIPVLNAKAMQKEWQQILKGRAAYDSRVWRWLNLILWVRKFSVELN
jgi:asparagine synthase (glutamine-hydrolysing)